MVVKQWGENGDPRAAIDESLQCLCVLQLGFLSEQDLMATYFVQIPPRFPRPKLENPARNDSVHGQLDAESWSYSMGNLEQTQQGIRAQPHEHTH